MSREQNPTLIEAKNLGLVQIDLDLIEGVSSEAGQQVDIVTEGRQYHSSGNHAGVATEAEYQGTNRNYRL